MGGGSHKWRGVRIFITEARDLRKKKIYAFGGLIFRKLLPRTDLGIASGGLYNFSEFCINFIC